MATSNRGWLLLALALVIATAGCADGDIDDPDGPSGVLQIVSLSSEGVTCGEEGFCEDDPALSCASNSACIVDPNDFGPCIFDDALDIEPWTGTARNVPTSTSGATSPFNDMTLEGVTIAYTWIQPCTTPTRFVGIGTTVPANSTGPFEFNPLSEADLAGNACILGNTANLTLTFAATTGSGDSITETISRQLDVELCAP